MSERGELSAHAPHLQTCHVVRLSRDVTLPCQRARARLMAEQGERFIPGYRELREQT